MQDDLHRVSHAIGRLLGRANMVTRMATRPKVVLEFPDVGSMYAFHADILKSLEPIMMVNSAPESRSGEGIVELEFGGVTYVLVCNQRFMTRSGKAVGYNSGNFVVRRGLPKSDQK